ncbi:MAG: YdcF family protein [Bryobacteraceae bacterium]|jgi:uncharacterized SAM-binding protein YcdF (DUF218 family)
MFLYFSKLLAPLLYPLTFSILLLAAAIILRKRRLWLPLCGSAFLVLSFLGSGPVESALMGSLENTYPPKPLAGIANAQAIVVLGGDIRMPNGRRPLSELAESSDRLLHALRLYKAGKAPRILLTGGNVEFLVGAGQIPEARTAAALLEEWGVPAEAILIEDRSRNTRENAVFSRAALEPLGVRRILLVTSASHMPRAFRVFGRLGFEVIPAPTDFLTGWSNPDFPFDFIPSAESLENSTLAIREWIGLAVYRVRGWA